MWTANHAAGYKYGTQSLSRNLGGSSMVLALASGCMSRVGVGDEFNGYINFGIWYGSF